MAIKILYRDQRNCPVVVCDVCQDMIGNAGEGAVVFPMLGAREQQACLPACPQRRMPRQGRGRNRGRRLGRAGSAHGLHHVESRDRPGSVQGTGSKHGASPRSRALDFLVFLGPPRREHFRSLRARWDQPVSRQFYCARNAPFNLKPLSYPFSGAAPFFGSLSYGHVNGGVFIGHVKSLRAP